MVSRGGAGNDGVMTIQERRSRYAGWLPEVLLALGLACVLANWALLVSDPRGGDPFLALGDVVGLAAAMYVRWRRPDLPVSVWVTLVPIGATSLCETLLDRLLSGGGSELAIAAANLIGAALAALGIVGMVYLVGLYPEGRLETRGQRVITSASWSIVVVPIVVTLSSPTIPFEYYVEVGSIATCASEAATPARRLPSPSR